MKSWSKLLLVMLTISPCLFGGTRIELNNGWGFRIDPQGIGISDGWNGQVPSQVEPVTIPHTWNIGKYDAYEGVAWYFCQFDLPAAFAAKHVELNFGATFYSAEIWFNGLRIGNHEGGYTAYSLDVSNHLQAHNLVAVRIDNRPGIATIPGFAMRLRSTNNIWYDWWHYGGIVRNVWLTITDSIQVRRQEIRSEVNGSESLVRDRVYLENHAHGPQRVSVKVTAYSPDQTVAATNSVELSLPPGPTDRLITLKILNPKLWDLDHPNLYRARVEVIDTQRRIVDQQSDDFGLRTIHIRDRHLLINGDRVRLSGMTRHEESPWEGLAETRGTILHDYDDMKSLQVTLTRPVHYPQNPEVLEYADRHGILLIPEIPLWQFSEAQMRDPRVLVLAKQQMRQMIEQAGNHPSIFAWSVCNESDTLTPGGKAYFHAMREFIREIDPDRYVSYADDSLQRVDRPEDSAANEADFLMMNQYFGSWTGPKTGLAPALDKIDRLFPAKMLIISEFGTAGIFADTKEEADRLRVQTMREQISEFAKREWIAGAIFWCYQDYKSHRNLRPGLQEGYVEMGLVDEYRQTRQSYDVWKELNAPAVLKAAWDEHPDAVPRSFTMRVTPNSIGTLPTYPLRDYRLTWNVRDARHTVVTHGERRFPELTTAVSVTEKLPQLPSDVRQLNLYLRLERPSGLPAVEMVLNWRRLEDGGQTIDQMLNRVGAEAGLTKNHH